ncbi:Do family serine endopeptidase [Lichenibacterium minor]|jgi:serine protease Do|uniref:Probable periplasmic serine endoprotease DegP-like n=1 Tax=Lichenibacterium minor TaxID=2316528 RepID=A0A4Q2UDG2_9HYPH|nr:Do family serine endopeptidase [Lichenibacterium minor]RYC33247.1 Do family serine endopeptidase [Lichenibacterium minor]
MTKRPTIRTALLGAVAVTALGAAVSAPSLLSTAPAQAAQIAGQPAPSTIAPGSFADVVDRVSPAVVSVKVKMVESNASDDEESGPQGMPNIPKGDPLERFFHQFQQRGMGGQKAKPHVGMAQGSGFFISADGYIVTNNHVVENATDVEVVTQDGKTVPATVVGTDKKTDLALIKVKSGANYPFVQWAPAVPRVGDWVIAVGNPFGLGGTVTAGIVSARGRDIGAGPYDDFLQIDAPVNRGNSGGPTFNVEGQVVGINTAIFSPSGGSVGIGFAIPTEVAKGVIQDLRDKGSVARGWLGIQIQPVTADIADSLGLKDTKGALVAEPQKGSPAADAGIKSGDVITAVNNDAVDGPKELSRKIAGLGPDKKVALTVYHDGNSKQVDVTLGTLPNDQQAKADAPKPQDEKAQLSSYGLTLAPAASIAGAGSSGVVVADIDPDGTAAQKGLQTGDVILEAAGKSVSKPSDVSAALADAKKDGHKAVLLRVKTGDNVRYVALSTTNAG